MSDNPPCEILAAAAVDHASAHGLAGAEAHVEHTLTHVVTWDSAAVLSAVSLPTKTRFQANIRVYAADGRCGMASGEARDAGAVCALVDKAADLLGSPSPFAGPADAYEQTDVGLGLMDRRQSHIEDADREAAVNDNIEDVRSADGVQPLAFRYTEVVRTRAMAASNGNARAEKGSHYTLYGRVSGHDGEHVVERSVESRLFADAASLPLGANLANQVARYVAPSPMPEGDRPIFIEPRVVAKIMAAVVPAFDRDRVDAGESFLTEGRQVGSEKLHMIDDALLAGGLATRAFDVRGVPALDLPLIREGTVGALYQGTELARALGGRSSGHEGAQGPWFGNLILRPGTRSRNMITPDLGPYLCLDSLTVSGKRWFDLGTGKLRLRGHFFSGGAGETPVYLGVHSLNTSFVALWSAIVEIANDQGRYGSVDVSTWVVEGLRVG